MIVDQSQVISVSEALFGVGGESLPAVEAFMDDAELDKVEDFHSTIRAIETATDLDFGDVLRGADVRASERESKIDKQSDMVLKVVARAPKAPRASRGGK